MMLFLFDIRRLPGPEDMLLMDWVITRKIPVILVLTKVDKVTQSQKVIQAKKIVEAFQCQNLHFVYYSTLKHIGRHELVALISGALKEL
jgi:GTP-binding protein EngB required for normal cell division